MAFTLPTSPTNGQTFVQGSVTFTYNSTLDQWVGSAGSASSGPTTGVITGTAAQDYQVAAAAPTVRSAAGLGAALVDGDLWYDTANSTLMLRKSGVWVNPIGGGGAVTGNYTWSTVFTGNAGDQWYDLAKHGPGTYRITFSTLLSSIFINYNGSTVNAYAWSYDDGSGFFTTGSQSPVAAAGQKVSDNGVTRGLFRYIGSAGVVTGAAARAAVSVAGVNCISASFPMAVAIAITKVEKLIQ